MTTPNLFAPFTEYHVDLSAADSTLNIPLTEMNREQREAVRMGKVDFVVTRDKTLSTYNYRLISKEKFYLEGKVRVYYLYELIPPDERHTPPQLAPVPTYGKP